MLTLNKKYIVFLCIISAIYIIQGEALFNFIFYGGMLLFFISVTYVLLISILLKVFTTVDKEEAAVNDTITCKTFIKDRFILPAPFLTITTENMKQVRWLWPFSTFEISNNIKLDKRGFYELDGVSIEVNDILFICKIKRIVKSGIKVKVYPQIYGLEASMEVCSDILEGTSTNIFTKQQSLAAGDVNKYYYGDNFNKIHWKVSAKMGELYTKNFEEADSKNLCILIDMDKNYLKEEKNDNKLINFAVSLINYFLYNEIKTAVYINNYEEQEFNIESKVSFQGLLEYFVVHKSLGETNLNSFIEINKYKLLDKKLIYIVTAEFNMELRKTIILLNSRGLKCKVFFIGSNIGTENINLTEVQCIKIPDIN